MAIKTDPAIRQWLEDRCKWFPFCEKRQQLIHEGKTREDAEYIALKEVGMPEKVMDDLAATKPEGVRGDGKTPQEVRAGEAAFRKQIHEKNRVPRSVFKGKSCSFREEVQWVADNLVIQAVTPEDAPSSSAWGLFLFARQSIGNEIIFRDKFHAKIHQAEIKSESDDESPFKDDGREILDTIEKLKRGSGSGGAAQGSAA